MNRIKLLSLTVGCLALLFATLGVPSLYASVLPAVNSSPGLGSTLLSAKTIDFHTATGDVATIAVPAFITKYQISSIAITNCSVMPILAAVGFFTGAGGTGTTLVTAGTITGASGATVILPMTLAGTVATTTFTGSSIFVRLTVANAAALTCDVGIVVIDWT